MIDPIFRQNSQTRKAQSRLSCVTLETLSPVYAVLSSILCLEEHPLIKTITEALAHRRFRKRWRRPQILHFCGDDRLIRSMHVQIRPRLLPYTSIVPPKTARSEAVAFFYEIVYLCTYHLHAPGYPPLPEDGGDLTGVGVTMYPKSPPGDRGNCQTALPLIPYCRTLYTRRLQCRLASVNVPHPRNPPRSQIPHHRAKRSGQIPHGLTEGWGVPGACNW